MKSLQKENHIVVKVTNIFLNPILIFSWQISDEDIP